MKTINILIYDPDGIDNFLNSFTPFIKKKFNLNVILYLTYSDADTIGSNDINRDIIDNIKSNTKKNKSINHFNILGLVSSGPETCPRENCFQQFTDYLTNQMSEMELDGQCLDYQFTGNRKNKYTKFVNILRDKNKSARIMTHVSSYKDAELNLDNLDNIYVINRAMQNDSFGSFIREIYYMFTSGIKHSHQIPLVMMNENIDINFRFKLLNFFGYNDVVLFDPITNNNSRSLVDFIESKDVNIYGRMNICGALSGTFFATAIGLLYWYNIFGIITMYWILSISILLSLANYFLIRMCTSTIRYIAISCNNLILFTSIITFLYLYLSMFCSSLLFTDCVMINASIYGIGNDYNISQIQSDSIANNNY